MAVPFPAGTVIDQARDWYLNVTWEAPDPLSPDPQNPIYIPVNLTGYTFTFAMREDYDEPIVLQVTSQQGFITTVPLQGEITIHLPNSLTDIPEGTYVAELMAESSGIETSVLKGPLPLSNKVVP